MKKWILIFSIFFAFPVNSFVGNQCPPTQDFSTPYILRPQRLDNGIYPVWQSAQLAAYPYMVILSDEGVSPYATTPDLNQSSPDLLGIETLSALSKYHPSASAIASDPAIMAFDSTYNFLWKYMKSLARWIRYQDTNSKIWLDTRFDLASRQDIAASSPHTFDPDWLLESIWTWTEWSDYLETLTDGSCTGGSDCRASYCRFPQNTLAANPDDSWDCEGAGSCPNSAGDCQNKEKTPITTGTSYLAYDLLETLSSGLGHSVVYAFVGASSKQLLPHYLTLTDLENIDYQDYMVNYIKDALSDLPAFGVAYPNKIAFYYTVGNAPGARLYSNWADISTDAPDYGGDASPSGSPNTTNLFNNGFSGPAKHRGSTDIYRYDDYIKGYYELAVKLKEAGVKYYVIVSPNWFNGCSGTLNADGTGTGCTDSYDCAAGDLDLTAADKMKCNLDQNEAAMIRKVAMMAHTVLIDTNHSGNTPHNTKCYSGDCSTSTDLGFSDQSFYDVASFLKHAAGAYHPRIYTVYEQRDRGNRPFIPADASTDEITASVGPNIPKKLCHDVNEVIE